MMKKTIFYFLISSIFSNLAIAQINLNDKVPNRNYTYRELLLQRAFTRQMMQNSRPKEMEGVGVTSNGIIKIKKEKNKEGKEEKKYLVFKRGCGDIELPDDDKEKLDKLRSGTRIKYRMKATRSCDIASWEVF